MTITKRDHALFCLDGYGGEYGCQRFSGGRAVDYRERLCEGAGLCADLHLGVSPECGLVD